MAKTRVRSRSGSRRTGRPIMVLLDLLGHRWALRVLWELRGKRLTFRELQRACGQISPTVLNARLRELRDGRLVELDDELGYGLSAQGSDLVDKFLPVVRWADRWSARRY